MRIVKVFRGVWREKGRRKQGESNGKRDKRTGVVYSTDKMSTTGATITPLTYKYAVWSFACYHNPKK